MMAAMRNSAPSDYTIHWLDDLIVQIPNWVHLVLAVIGGLIGLFVGPHYFHSLPKQGAALGAFIGLLSVYILRLGIMLVVFGGVIVGFFWLLWWLWAPKP